MQDSSVEFNFLRKVLWSHYRILKISLFSTASALHRGNQLAIGLRLTIDHLEIPFNCPVIPTHCIAVVKHRLHVIVLRKKWLTTRQSLEEGTVCISPDTRPLPPLSSCFVSASSSDVNPVLVRSAFRLDGSLRFARLPNPPLGDAVPFLTCLSSR